MDLAISIKNYFEHHPTNFELIRHKKTETLTEAAKATGISPAQIARAVILKDELGFLMAILPADRLINFHSIEKQLGRVLEPAPIDDVRTLMPDCELGSVPPMAQPYGLELLIDNSLKLRPSLYIEPGSHTSLLHLPAAEFMKLHAKALWLDMAYHDYELISQNVYDLVIPQGLSEGFGEQGLLPGDAVKEQLQKINKLPAMPKMVQQLLHIRNSNSATIRDLVDIVEQDPSLAAQIIRFARSAYFNYRGKVETIDEAVASVLGFDMTVNMSLGLAVSKGFKNPKEGPLGLNAFWEHSVYSAAMMQALSVIVPRNLNVLPGMAYLCGLLHDFGFLLLGHLFKPEFFTLNKMVAANPQIPVTLIEKRVLGSDHTQIGTWLMEAWEMPQEVIITLSEHHNEFYTGECSAYANLMLLVDRVLKAHGSGYAAQEPLPPALLTALGISLNDVLEIADKLLGDSKDGLDVMVQQLAA